MENHYETLEIPPFSHLGEIKRAFRRLAKTYHPDAGGDPCEYHHVRKAYEILIDQSSREDYDQRLRESLAQEKERTALNDVDIATKIKVILAWSITNPRFDSSVINSFADRLSKGRELTSGQAAAVDNVIRGFGIDFEEWLGDQEKTQRCLDEYLEQQRQLDKNYDF